MWDLIVSVPDDCLSFYFLSQAKLYFTCVYSMSCVSGSFHIVRMSDRFTSYKSFY